METRRTDAVDEAPYTRGHAKTAFGTVADKYKNINKYMYIYIEREREMGMFILYLYNKCGLTVHNGIFFL